MITKFVQAVRNSLVGVLLLTTVGLAVPAVTFAAGGGSSSSTFQSDACSGLSQLGGGCNESGSSLSTVIKFIVNILSAVIGAVAIIMIIISGLRYITSGGDAQKVAAAKSALVYAIVGLLIVAFAQLLVHFVLASASSAGTGSGGGGGGGGSGGGKK